MDRRADIRARIPINASVVAKSRQFVGTVVDISSSGVLMIPPVSSRPGLILQLCFALPGPNQLPMSILGSVVREADYAKRYAWGVRFTEISPEHAKRIQSVVYRRTIEDIAVSIDGTGSYKELPRAADSTLELTEKDLEVIAGPTLSSGVIVRRYGSAKKTSSTAIPAKPPRPPHKRIDDDSDIKRLYDAAVGSVSGKAKKKRKSWLG